VKDSEVVSRDAALSTVLRLSRVRSFERAFSFLLVIPAFPLLQRRRHAFEFTLGTPLSSPAISPRRDLVSKHRKFAHG